MVATDWDMKALTVLTLVILIAATALAYGHSEVAAVVSASAPEWPGEPTMLLLSGSALLGLAGAVRRCTF